MHKNNKMRACIYDQLLFKKAKGPV